MMLGLYLQNEDFTCGVVCKPIEFLDLSCMILVVVGVVIVLSIAIAYWNANKLEKAVLLSVCGDIRFDEDSSGEVGTTYYVFVGRKDLLSVRI